MSKPSPFPAAASQPIRRWLAALAAGALACAIGTAWADPPARVGRLSWLAGEVTLRASADAAAGPAQRNWPMGSGQVLATGSASRAEVWIGSSTLRLDADTELQIELLDDTQIHLRLNRGSLALHTATPDAARGTRVASALGSFSPAEPGALRLDTRGSTIAATAWQGALRFEGQGLAFTVHRGQRAELSSAPGGIISVTPLAPAADEFQRFVQSRDESFDGRTATRYVSPEMTGIENLDSHGRWAQTAEYGAVWLPTVNPEWAPYRFGRWAWVAPWGWTWIDDAPWGFAPFHYGRWALWNGHWSWVPGAYVAWPVYAPALVAPPASVRKGKHITARAGRVGGTRHCRAVKAHHAASVIPPSADTAAPPTLFSTH